MTTMRPVDWKKVARVALLSRKLDQLEIEELTPQGRIKYQFSSGGHELVQVLLAFALDHPHDGAAVYYRSRPFLLASGLTPAEALAANMARLKSPSGGRDAGVMYNLPRRTGATVLPTSGDVGAQYTPAAGWASAIRYRQETLDQPEWSGAIAVAMGGEASVAANGFWAALNIAATQNLPMLFCIEDNNFGLSVPSILQTPGGNIAANLAAFSGLKILDGDGTHPLTTWQLIQEAVQHVRSGAGPCLLRAQVVRLLGHTFVDDQSYKSPEIRQAEAGRDPLLQLHNYLLDSVLSEEDWQALENEVRLELNQALQEAEASPQPDPTQVHRFMFFDGTPPQMGGLRSEGVLPPLEHRFSPSLQEPGQPGGLRMNLIDAVRRTLEVEMRLNPRILVFGEDVGVKGGVHGATQGMQKQFGPQRVFDTSLNEDGIIGRATGMALAGLLPVPEIQFRKYADPAHEQISDLGTIRWRTGNNFAAPVIVRIPVGFSKKTGDPWHSVSGEAIYAHLLGWRIAYPSNAADAVGLLRTALRSDDPTMFLEHRALLDTPEARRPYPGDEYSIPFGKAAHLTRGDSLSVITWGAMAPRCLEAAASFPGRIHLLDLRTIIPWDQEAVLESVRTTGKVLIVHEDTLTGGFGAEISAVIARQAFTFLDAPVARLAVADVPIPFNLELMESVVPSVERIRENMQDLLAY